MSFKFLDTGEQIQNGDAVFYIVERAADKNGNREEIIKMMTFGAMYGTKCSQGLYRQGPIRSDHKLFARRESAEHELSVNKLWHKIWECMYYKRKRPSWMTEEKINEMAKLLNLI